MPQAWSRGKVQPTDPTLEQAPGGSCSPWRETRRGAGCLELPVPKGLHCPGGTRAGADLVEPALEQGRCEEERGGGENCSELTTTPASHPPALLVRKSWDWRSEVSLARRQVARRWF